MPLRDHFRPPLSEVRAWEGFHSAWASSISDALNQSLPTGYFAEEEVHAGRNVEIDVATFDATTPAQAEPAREWLRPDTPDPGPWAPDPPAGVGPAVFADDFEVRVVASRAGRRVVAAVELVSPGNKDRPETRQAFAAKCASYLYQGIALVVVDVVTERHADLHGDVLGLAGLAGVGSLPGPGLFAAAYRPIRRDGRDEVEVWPARLAVGSVLPSLPLWLDAVTYVRLDLEATYTSTLARRRIAG
ncbi:MAG: DUF4058 family protein [Gemmataceae bacterium]|nr:DUF4058 family protein [Gemmataceae bacterium]